MRQRDRPTYPTPQEVNTALENLFRKSVITLTPSQAVRFETRGIPIRESLSPLFNSSALTAMTLIRSLPNVWAYNTIWYVHNKSEYYITNLNFNQRMTPREYTTMGKATRSTQLEQWQLINCPISESQQGAFNKWRDDLTKKNASPELELLGAGYKLSIVFKSGMNAYCVTVSGTADSENGGKSLVSWSDDMQEAIWLSLYKVTVVFKNGEWEDTKTSKWG